MKFEIIFDLENSPAEIKFKGRLSECKTTDEHERVFVDGWVKDRLSKDDASLGVYNLISFNTHTKTVTLKNDTLGQRPLFFYSSFNKFIVSDNFWTVISLLESNKISYGINHKSFERLTKFQRLLPSHATLVDEVYRLPAGSEALISSKITIPKIYFRKNMVQKPDYNVKLEDVVDQTYLKIGEGFDHLLENFPDEELWFGNSGGLDSRIIPALAKKRGLKINGFLVSDKKIIRSHTDIASERIAEKYNFLFKKYNYDCSSGFPRLLRDILVNPLGPANFHKNPAFIDLKDKIILNGGNSFLITNDSDYWLNVKESKNKFKTLASKFIFRNEPKKEEEYEITNLIADELKGISEDDWFSICRQFHARILNATSPMGGFESMSFSGDFHYIYHPWLTNPSLEWPEDVFFGRKVQTRLMETYWPDLVGIPNQVGQKLKSIESKGKLSSFSKMFRYKLRGDGLRYKSWGRSKWYKDFENDLSEEMNSYDHMPKCLRLELLNNDNKFLGKIINQKIALMYLILSEKKVELLF